MSKLPQWTQLRMDTLKSFMVFGLIAICCGSLSCETYDENPDEFAIDFDYSKREMFGFSIDEFLQTNASHLLPYAEMISHVAGKERISPRALLALMEEQSGAVENPEFDVSKPFGDLSEKTGFLEQLRAVSSRLRGLEESSDLRVIIGQPQDDVLAILSFDDLQQLGDTYQRLFPGVVSLPKPIMRASAPISLQFVYPLGESWMFGGTHSDSGGASPMSSIDFQKSGNKWGDTINANVVAAAPGTVKKYSSCYLTVIHSDGWSTGYYHLSDIMVKSGDVVKANQPIAKYANSKAQALCDGGSSTGPHVHWTVYNSNREVDLAGKVISGYTVHPSTIAYDSNCSRMYYEKSGKKVCPWDYVRNDGTGGPIDNCPNDPNKTDPGICGCGVPEGNCPTLTPRLEMSKSTFAANETIVVRYYNLPGNSTDWVGIYNEGAANTAELQYLYSNGAKNGTLQFTGRAVGKYEARLFFNDSYTLEAKISFSVGSTTVDNCPNDPNKTEPGVCGCGVPEGSCSTCKNTLAVNERLSTGQYRCSADGRFKFGMSSGGNLALLEGTKTLWSANTCCGAAFVAMQGDGNLVVYDGSSAKWSSRTAGKAGASLTVENNGTAVIRYNGSIIWSVGSSVPVDNCPNDPNKTEPGQCGCGVPEGTCAAKTYQAESYSSQSGCKLATNNTGYTGSGFMDYGGNGTWVEWNNINVPAAGSRLLTFRYANGSAKARQSSIIVNGVAIGNVAFNATGGWTIWKTATITVSLRAGNNTIRVLANTSSGGPNLDSVDVK